MTAPGITAEDESDTVPWIEPAPLCAKAFEHDNAIATPIPSAITRFRALKPGNIFLRQLFRPFIFIALLKVLVDVSSR
jgi:hypothetical protein